MLRLLEEHPEYSQRQIAAALGLSLGGVNYCLNALIQKGLVKVSNFRASSHKLRYAYVLTPRGLAEKTELMGLFLRRKMKEFETLKAEIEALKLEALPLDDPAGEVEAAELPPSPTRNGA